MPTKVRQANLTFYRIEAELPFHFLQNQEETYNDHTNRRVSEIQQSLHPMSKMKII